MKTSYAVKWREPDGSTHVGRLALGPRELRLEGRTSGGTAVDLEIGYEEIQGLRIKRSAADRLDDRPALVVDRADGSYSVTSTAMGAGILQELVGRLASLRLAPPRRATIVLPLKDGALERVREFVEQGPPFDPAETPLTRHQLLLTPQEAIFIFEVGTDEGLSDLLSQLDVWAAAVAWRDLVAGPPRLAEVAYDWERPEPRVVPNVGLGL
jgi:hypothetical protein